MTHAELLEAALYHFERGRPVLAVSKTKAPYQSGWDKWFSETQTEGEVRELFSNGVYGIGLLTFPATDLAVLDFDGTHASEAWALTSIALPPTARNFTRSGGHHLIFRIKNSDFNIERKVRLVKAECDCKDNNSGRPKPCGVDFLTNGFFIVPPTPGYREDPDHPLEDAVELPDAVVKLVLEKARWKCTTPITNKQGEKISQGERNSTLTSLAGSMRRRGMSLESILAALTEENARRCDPPLDETEVKRIAESIGKKEPVFEPEHLTDVGNGRRLVRQFGDDMRFSKALGWLVWNEQRWKRDNILDAERMAKATVQTIYAEAASCADEDLRKKLADHARRSELRQRVEAMLWMAQSEPKIPITTEELDQTRWLLNVANGTIELKKGELRPHRREDLITKLAPVEFNPDAGCPTFQTFLHRIFAEDESLISFVQRAFGYALTGSVEEQCLFFFHGSGHNGKTTLVNAVLDTLGPDYAQTAAPGLLMVKRNEQHPTELADLWGKRMIATIEVEQGKRLAEVLVKQLTGGDRLKGRFMRRDFFQFSPTHKIFLVANHKPVIKGTDLAIWRRIKLVPFKIVIPEAERDTSLPEKLRAESPGILAWCVWGCLEWQKNGLGTPEEVKAATAKYRTEMDTLGDFIAERCEVDLEEEVTKADLYAAYTEWAEKSGEHPLTKKEFGMRLNERGFEENRSGKDRIRVWRGLKLV